MSAEPKPGLNAEFDPTQNVRELVDAAIQRQDDLRTEQEKLFTGKIEGLQHQIEAAERGRVEQKKDWQTSIDSAFRAASELVRLQADGQATSIHSIQIALNDVRDRLGRMEAVKQGQQDTRSDSRSNIGMIVGILGAVFGFLMLAAALMRGAAP